MPPDLKLILFHKLGGFWVLARCSMLRVGFVEKLRVIT